MKSPCYPLACLDVYMYTAAMPVGEGSMWDELMELVGEPSLPPAVEPTQTVMAGRLNDDGTYTQYGRRQTREEVEQYEAFMQREYEAQVKRANSEISCRAMGLEIVHEGDGSLAESLGIVKAGDWQHSSGLWLQ